MSLVDFLSSWELFAQPYVLTILAAAVLAVLGVVTAARRQVFMAAAVAQASTFGYALFALFAGATATELSGSLGRDIVVIGSAIAAALLTMLGDGRQSQGGRLDGDERTAWLFVASGAGAILVLAHAPAGMEQFRRIQNSSVIGATTADLVAFSVLLLMAFTVLFAAGRSLVLLLADPVMASAIGMRVGAWNLGIAVFSGVCVGMAVRSTGMLFAFGCLALPVMITKQVCGEVGSLFWASPLTAAIFAALGLWVAYAWDLPPGQVVVGLLCAALVAAGGLRLAWDRFGQ